MSGIVHYICKTRYNAPGALLQRAARARQGTVKSQLHAISKATFSCLEASFLKKKSMHFNCFFTTPCTAFNKAGHMHRQTVASSLQPIKRRLHISG